MMCFDTLSRVFIFIFVTSFYGFLIFKGTVLLCVEDRKSYPPEIKLAATICLNSNYIRLPIWNLQLFICCERDSHFC